MNLEHNNISQKNLVVEVLVALETCLASFDHELGAQGIKTKNRGEGTIGAAGNDAKFLTSYGSSALILK
jgi:hypothetical protein